MTIKTTTVHPDHYTHTITVPTNNPKFTYELAIYDRGGYFALPHSCDEWGIGDHSELDLFIELLTYARDYRKRL